jgi:hypothetical protein
MFQTVAGSIFGLIAYLLKGSTSKVTPPPPSISCKYIGMPEIKSFRERYSHNSYLTAFLGFSFLLVSH